jgi:hypothetical protein
MKIVIPVIFVLPKSPVLNPSPPPPDDLARALVNLTGRLFWV